MDTASKARTAHRAAPEAGPEWLVAGTRPVAGRTRKILVVAMAVSAIGVAVHAAAGLPSSAPAAPAPLVRGVTVPSRAEQHRLIRVRADEPLLDHCAVRAGAASRHRCFNAVNGARITRGRRWQGRQSLPPAAD